MRTFGTFGGRILVAGLDAKSSHSTAQLKNALMVARRVSIVAGANPVGLQVLQVFEDIERLNAGQIIR